MSPTEIKSVVESAKKAGLIRGPGQFKTLPIESTKTAKNGPQVQWIEVTPALATEWLRCNLGNRNIKEETVLSYSRDMKAGEWRRTHQGIAFDSNGRLIDGQHRLKAIVHSGATVDLLVTSGLPAEVAGKRLKTQDAMDRGVVRSIGDQLKLQHGMANANLAAGCARTIGALCIEKTRVRKFTMNEVLGILDVYGPQIKSLVDTVESSKPAMLRRSGILGAIAFARRSHQKDADSFFEGLLSGACLKADNPCLAFRNFIFFSSGKLMFENGAVNQELLCALTLACLKGFILKQSMPKLQADPDAIAFFREAQKDAVKKVRDLFP